MAIGASRRIVIEVDNLDLKRHLHSALAKEGRSLKEWFLQAALQYLGNRTTQRTMEGVSTAEATAQYRSGNSTRPKASSRTRRGSK